MAFDAKANLIAGSDGSGLIYRISPSGESFVLYSAAKKEITALALDKAGNIYAAGVGEKRPGTPAATFSMPPNPASAPATGPGQSQPGLVVITTASGGTPPTTNAFPFPGMNSGAGSDIYRIAPDGSPTRIWTSREDLVYALAFDPRGHLLAGTGNHGHVYAIGTTGNEDDFTDLLKASATQVTAFAAMPNGGLYVSTSNLGKSVPARRNSGSGRQLRQRRLRCAEFLPLGSGRIPRRRQCRTFCPQRQCGQSRPQLEFLAES